MNQWITNSRTWLLGLIILGAMSHVHANPSRFEGRLVLPKGVDPTAIDFTLHDQAISEVDNDIHGEPLVIEIGTDGLFNAETTSDTLKLNLEITGPGVRRGRFPWPDSNATRSVIEMEPGESFNLLVTDAETGLPLPNAHIGPVYPSEEAAGYALDKQYPFFTKTNSDGKALLTGLTPKMPYAISVSVPGYIRQRVSFPEEVREGTISLNKGGATLIGTLRGSRTQAVYPKEILYLRSNTSNVFVFHRVDEKGNFTISGLPSGEWQIVPVIERLGDMKPMDLTLRQNQLMRGITVEVSEGIDITGTVVDADTGFPIPEASLTIQGIKRNADERGNFAFAAVVGPWPATINVEHPGFLFVMEEQDTEKFPINGYDGISLDDLVIKLRRARYLDVTTSWGEEAEPLPAILELLGPMGEGEPPVERHRITQENHVFPLKGIGSRMALARTSDGRVSDLLVPNTGGADTTTTLYLEMGPGAKLFGSLVYKEGPPAPGFRLALTSRLSNKDINWLILRPDGEGNFSADALPPGPVQLRFLRPDNSIFLEESITLVRGETLQIDRTISRGSTLAGVVVDPDGGPLQQIFITAWGVDPQGNRIKREMMSGEGGAFRLDGFGGNFLDILQVNHFQWAPVDLTGVGIPNENFTLVMQPRAGITVEVDASNEALKGGRVMVLMGTTRSDSLAASQWYYTIEHQESLAGRESVLLQPMISGRIQVAVETDGLWDVSAPFDWSGLESKKVIQLKPGHRSNLTVRVEGIEGAALRRMTVSLLNTSLPENSPDTVFTPTVRPPSTLEFKGLPAGQYLLVATTSEGVTESLPNLVLQGGESRTVDLAFQKGTFQLTGTVLAGSDGQERVTGAKVMLYPADIPEPDPLDETTSDGSGRFRFDLVPGGRPLLLVVYARNLRQTTPPITLTKSEEIEIQLPEEIKVTLQLPPSLTQPDALSPDDLMIVQNLENGSIKSVPIREIIKGPVTVYPGLHVFRIDNLLLGQVTVPPSGGVIQLPEPQGI